LKRGRKNKTFFQIIKEISSIPFLSYRNALSEKLRQNT